MKNQSNVQVRVTITAEVSDLGEIEVVGNRDFGESESCSMYLAIVDDEGNEQALSENGEVSISIGMRKTPDNAYVYRINEEDGSYTYEFSAFLDEIDFDSYSFGMTGYCNPNGRWEDISVHPKVRVTWKVEPILSDDPEDLREEENDIPAEENEDTEIRETSEKETETTINTETQSEDNEGKQSTDTGDENSDIKTESETGSDETESDKPAIGDEEEQPTESDTTVTDDEKEQKLENEGYNPDGSGSGTAVPTPSVAVTPTPAAGSVSAET